MTWREFADLHALDFLAASSLDVDGLASLRPSPLAVMFLVYRAAAFPEQFRRAPTCSAE